MKVLVDFIHKAISLNFDREVVLTEIDLTKPSRYKVKSELSADHTFRPYEEKDLQAVIKFCEEIGDPTEVDLIKRLIEHKCNGVLFFKDAALIGYYWWYAKRIKNGYSYALERLPIKLDGENEVYAEYFYITPKNRGQGLALYLLSEMYATHRADGYTKIYGYVDIKNISAHWIYKILGCEEIKRFKEYTITINGKKRKIFYYGNHPKDVYHFVTKNAIRLMRSIITKKD